MKIRNKYFIICAVLLLKPAAAFCETDWEGDWTWKDSVHSSDLEISKVTDKRFHFSFIANYKDHIGTLEEDAVISGNEAEFKGKIYGQDCQVKFKKEKSTV